MASVVDGRRTGTALSVDANFLRRGRSGRADLGERGPACASGARARDQRAIIRGACCSFRWQSSGLIAARRDQRADADDRGRTRRASRASGTCGCGIMRRARASDAVVTLDFDALDGGFSLPADADRVDPRAIDRMFISLVPPDYVEGSSAIRAAPRAGAGDAERHRAATARGACSRSTTRWRPSMGFGIATAYDDMYHLPPERMVEAIVAARLSRDDQPLCRDEPLFRARRRRAGRSGAQR